MSIEKEMLGVYISGHPLDKYKDIVNRVGNITTFEISQTEDGEHAIRDGEEIVIAGMIAAKKSLLTKSNTMMAFVDLEDFYGTCEVIVFPRVYDRYRELIKEDEAVAIKGRINFKEDEAPKILADTIVDLAVLSNKKEKLKLRIKADMDEIYALNEIKRILKAYDGVRPSGDCAGRDADFFRRFFSPPPRIIGRFVLDLVFFLHGAGRDPDAAAVENAAGACRRVYPVFPADRARGTASTGGTDFEARGGAVFRATGAGGGERPVYRDVIRGTGSGFSGLDGSRRRRSGVPRRLADGADGRGGRGGEADRKALSRGGEYAAEQPRRTGEMGRGNGDSRVCPEFCLWLHEAFRRVGGRDGDFFSRVGGGYPEALCLSDWRRDSWMEPCAVFPARVDAGFLFSDFIVGDRLPWGVGRGWRFFAEYGKYAAVLRVFPVRDRGPDPSPGVPFRFFLAEASRRHQLPDAGDRWLRADRRADVPASFDACSCPRGPSRRSPRRNPPCSRWPARRSRGSSSPRRRPAPSTASTLRRGSGPG